jgi:hypothetical protein
MGTSHLLIIVNLLTEYIYRLYVARIAVTKHHTLSGFGLTMMVQGCHSSYSGGLPE